AQTCGRREPPPGELLVPGMVPGMVPGRILRRVGPNREFLDARRCSHGISTRAPPETCLEVASPHRPHPSDSKSPQADERWSAQPLQAEAACYAKYAATTS